MTNIFLIAENTFLKWLVGNNPDAAGEPVFYWGALPESWGWFVFWILIAAVAFAVFWLYRREINTCPMHLKMLMGFMRFTVLAILIALLLQPSVFYQQIDEIKPVITLLRDASLSFNRGDQYQDETTPKELAKMTGLDEKQIAAGDIFRNKILNEVINRNDQELVQALRDKGSIRVVDFADGLDPVAVIPAIVKSIDKVNDDEQGNEPETESGSDEDDSTDAGEGDTEKDSLIRDKIPPLVSNGLGSDIAQALRETLNTTRLSSIVLISDGQNTTSEDPVELAELAASKNIPIYVVGIGDSNPPKNLGVYKIFTPQVAFPDEQFVIDARIQALSLDESEPLPPSIEVELLQHQVDPKTGDVTGAPVSLQTKKFDIPSNRRTFKAVFAHTTNVPGQYKYSIRVPQLENEINVADNTGMSKMVEVENKKYKVLLISGLPNWDYQQVYRFLQRDQTVVLSCWLQSMDETRVQEGNEPISYLPRTIEELGEYNVIIMMDPNPEEFDEKWMELLKKFCKIKAGGLLYMAGPQYTTEFVTMNRLKDFRQILPVKFGDLENIAISQDLADAKADGAGNMLIVPSKLEHPVMSFDEDRNQTASIWSQLPNVHWTFPTLESKPTAEVLIERGDNVNEDGNQPILVTGRYGAGTVMYFGFQGTFLWRSVGLQAEHFDDFWMQTVRFLFKNKSLQGESRGRIETDFENYELGSKITFYLEARNEQLVGLTNPTLIGTITDENGRPQEIEFQREPGQDSADRNEGRYRGTYSATRLGTFKVAVDIGPDSERLIEPIYFNVIPPSVESNRFWLNEEKLRSIATQSGGKYISLTDIESLPEELPRIVTKVEFNSPAKPIWDLSQLARYLAFFLPVVLLGCEWALRKWNKLL